MLWILNKGYCVVGIEFYELPVEQFFEENKIEKIVTIENGVKIYESLDKRLKVFVQDIIEFFSNTTLKFDIVIDRGSLVALDPKLRLSYLKSLVGALNDNAHLFFETMEFDQSKFGGPPFIITNKEFQLLMESSKLFYKTLSCEPYEKKIADLETTERIFLAIKLPNN